MIKKMVEEKVLKILKEPIRIIFELGYVLERTETKTYDDVNTKILYIERTRGILSDIIKRARKEAEEAEKSLTFKKEMIKNICRLVNPIKNPSEQKIE